MAQSTIEKSRVGTSEEPHRLTIIKAKVRGKDTKYTVEFEGEVVYDGPRPEYDCMRILKGRGLSGVAEFWWKDSPFPSMWLDIERDAKWTVSDANTGLVKTKWQPYAKYAGQPDEDDIE